MKQLIIIFYLIFICLSIFSEEFTPEIFDELKIYTKMAYNDEFDEPLKYFKNLQEKMPNHPMGYFFEIAALEKIQADYMTDYNEVYFQKLLSKAISVTEKFVKSNPKEPLGIFFLGCIYGYKGTHNYRIGNVVSALIEGLKAVNNLKKAHEMDEKLWDVYYGLGVYKYWKSEYSSKVNPFAADKPKNQTKGIEYLKTAIEKGTYSNSEAACALIRIYMHEKQYSDAYDLIMNQIKKYPNSIFLRRFKSDVLRKLEKWQEVYNENLIITKLLDSKSFTGSNAWLHNCYSRGISAMKLGKTEESRKCFIKVVNRYEKNKDEITFKNMVSQAKKNLKLINEGKLNDD